jgi:hypothetical protein
MLENRTVPAIYNDTDGEGDQQYDETGRLVPAQTNRHFGTYAGFDVGICDEIEDERNSE